jgi:hypothetical protein
MKMAVPDPTVRSCEGNQAQEQLMMRKDIEESIKTISDTALRTEVDVEDERSADAERTGATGTSTGGDRRRGEREARHCPSCRPQGGLAEE